jgi:DNA-binding XRE family transcriptional regulator
VLTIKKVRSELGLTQKQIAPLLGMSQQGVCRVETGYEGRSETKQHIAHLVAIEILEKHGLIAELEELIETTKNEEIK